MSFNINVMIRESDLSPPTLSYPPSNPLTIGEILLTEFLVPQGMSQVELAQKMGVPIQRVNTLINGRRDVTAETAVLLSRVLKTSAEFWMNLQTDRDLYLAKKYLDEAA
jgi:antitoxin HigA-1